MGFNMQIEEQDIQGQNKFNSIYDEYNTSKGEIIRYFSSPYVSPFDEVEWEKRECKLTDSSGEAIYSQEEVEAPMSWSQMATLVVASKYFYGTPGTAERENSIRVLISRVANTIAEWGKKDDYFSSEDESLIFKDELISILLNQRAAFNSPVWFNVGVQKHPQTSACFIISVDDTLESLTNLQSIEARLFKFGSGTGTNFSTLRSQRESLSGGGVASGPVSFMRALDAWAGIIKSGGKTRRAAKMMILNVEHPDIREFINCKPLEEKKAQSLIDAGYEGNFSVKGGAYDSVCFQNANLSVRVTDEFMEAAIARKTFKTKNVATKEISEEIDAFELLQELSKATYECGDPGIQFDTTINEWNTCAKSGRINASNPCSEFMSIDNSACNLSSINLLKFLSEDGSFDLKGYKHVVDIMIRAQDILINNSSYPVEAIGNNAKKFRQLGLGYANLGALLMTLGLPYDSDAGREWAAALTAVMTGQAYLTSALLAERLGEFSTWNENKNVMLKIIERHFEAAKNIPSGRVPSEILATARAVWKEALEKGKCSGFRNSQVTVLAPTGTISFMMDCDTTGIEPDLALIKYKRLSDGGMLTVVNQSVQQALKSLSYSEEAISKIIEHIDSHGTIEGALDLKSDHLDVFDCALTPNGGSRCIHYSGHLKMMGAVQPFLSGAISKTVNLPNNTTLDEITDIYIQAWRMGLKSVALYRDGSKRTQPLTTKESSNTFEKEQSVIYAKRRALPSERMSITHRFMVAGLKGYLTVGLYENGEPGEIFLVVAKEGSTLSGVMDAFATAVSLSLQHGVPLITLIKKFTHMRFEPAGFTDNKKIPMAKSIIDYIFRWLGQKFLSLDDQIQLGLVHLSESNSTEISFDLNGNNLSQVKELKSLSAYFTFDDSPPCTNCGSSFMVRQGSCYVCLNCGAQGGCG